MSGFGKVLCVRLIGWCLLAVTTGALLHGLLTRELSWFRIGASIVVLVVVIRAYAAALRAVRFSGSVTS